MSKKYEAMVLSCIDPRFQPLVYNYLKKKKLTGKYSSFTIAGAAIGVTASKFKKWHSTFWDNFEKSLKDIDKEKSIVLKDIFNEAFELSDLIISKTTNIKSNKSKLTNILKQEVKILT